MICTTVKRSCLCECKKGYEAKSDQFVNFHFIFVFICNDSSDNFDG